MLLLKNCSLFLGPIVCFELFGNNESDLNVKLNELPTTFKGLEKDIFLLVGAIEHTGKNTGHYTALRYTSSWTRYDDLSDNPTRLSGAKSFKIKLLFYKKNFK